MNGIKNIIFDLGGIFVNVDYKKTAKAFTDLGVKDFESFFAQHQSNFLFEEWETGRISPADFCTALREISECNFSDDEIKTAWGAMVLDFPVERFEWLKTISQKYNVYLYSNINALHFDRFHDILSEEIGWENFSSQFKTAYYSHIFGYRKPHIESYIALLNDAKLNASETLFIDDTAVNLEGAKAAGLHTLHLVAPMTVLDLEL